MKPNKLPSGLESEKQWVDLHPEYYDDVHHQELVKTNIEVRYRVLKMLSDIERTLKEFE